MGTVRKTKGRIERKGKPNVSSRLIYIKILRRLGQYTEAREVLRRLPELLETEGITVSLFDFDSFEAAQIILTCPPPLEPKNV